MSKTRLNLLEGRPLLDLASFGRPGPGRRDRLSPTEIEHIRRTVARTPEVMVKVLSKGGQDLKSIQRHVDYLSRRGELDLEMDDGESLHGRDAQKTLVDDWDLDIDDRRRRSDLAAINRSRMPKLVHKVLFSMPPGTPPEKVLIAVRNFAREEFAFKHRYAMVLHTDEPHPHVHMLLKAMSERGERLHIKKATLRGWRHEFARHLRALGVEANATERAVRGQGRAAKLDGIYRASRRGYSTHMQARLNALTRELASGSIGSEPGRSKLLQTRREVRRGWLEVGNMLFRSGAIELANEARRFSEGMLPPQTEKEWLAGELARRLRSDVAKGPGQKDHIRAR